MAEEEIIKEVEQQPPQEIKEEQKDKNFEHIFTNAGIDGKIIPKRNFFYSLSQNYGFIVKNPDKSFVGYKPIGDNVMIVRGLNSNYAPNRNKNNNNNNYISICVIKRNNIDLSKGKPVLINTIQDRQIKSFDFDMSNLNNPTFKETKDKIIKSLSKGNMDDLGTNRSLTVNHVNKGILPSEINYEDYYGKTANEFEDDDIENEKPISDAVLEDKKEEEKTPIEPKEEREIDRMDPEEEIEDSPETPESPKIKGKIPKKLRLTDGYSNYQNDSEASAKPSLVSFGDEASAKPSLVSFGYDDDYSDFEDSIYSNPSSTFGSSKNEFDDFFDSKGFMKLKGPDIFFFSTSKDGTQLISKFAFDKAKGQPNNSNNNNSQDSLLKLIVRASQDNKGEVKLEDIGEIQDLNGDITKLYSDMQKLKSEINLSNRKRDFARRDKLIIKYNKKKLKLSDLISKYSKEVYRLSTLNKKKKATIATHKYLMNKLNKLK